MNSHPTNALPRTCIDDPDRSMAATRQRPQPRRRQQMTRPRDSLDDVAHIPAAERGPRPREPGIPTAQPDPVARQLTGRFQACAKTSVTVG